MTVIYNMSIDRADKPWIGDRRFTENNCLTRRPAITLAAIDRLSTVKKGYWPPLSIIGHVTYAPLSGVYECPLCSHGPRGPVGV